MVISGHSSFLLYGKGVFTTIAIYRGELFLWEKHWRRLTGSAAKIGTDLSEYTEQAIHAALTKEVATGEAAADGKLRVTFIDEQPGDLWPVRQPTAQKTRLHIMLGARRPAPTPFKLTISEYPVSSHSPLTGVKSCNYLEQILAINEAKRRGFHEGIRVNERGQIVSATMANVFWLRDDVLYTPTLKTGCLPGTTREYVLENLECREVEVGLEVLKQADAIYLTSAGLGVQRVAVLDGKIMRGEDHPILDVIARSEPA